MAKFHLASLLANKLANTSWPTSCRTSLLCCPTSSTIFLLANLLANTPDQS